MDILSRQIVLMKDHAVFHCGDTLINKHRTSLYCISRILSGNESLIYTRSYIRPDHLELLLNLFSRCQVRLSINKDPSLPCYADSVGHEWARQTPHRVLSHLFVIST
jgi:hypothetical protein